MSGASPSNKLTHAPFDRRNSPVWQFPVPPHSSAVPRRTSPSPPGDRHAPQAQLHRPRVRHVEARLLDLIDDLLQLGRRELRRGNAILVGERRYGREIELLRERRTRKQARQ